MTQLAIKCQWPGLNHHFGRLEFFFHNLISSSPSKMRKRRRDQKEFRWLNKMMSMWISHIPKPLTFFTLSQKRIFEPFNSNLTNKRTGKNLIRNANWFVLARNVSHSGWKSSLSICVTLIALFINNNSRRFYKRSMQTERVSCNFNMFVNLTLKIDFTHHITIWQGFRKNFDEKLTIFSLCCFVSLGVLDNFHLNHFS